MYFTTGTSHFFYFSSTVGQVWDVMGDQDAVDFVRDKLKVRVEYAYPLILSDMVRVPNSRKVCRHQKQVLLWYPRSIFFLV